MYYITSWGTQRFPEEKRKKEKRKVKGKGNNKRKGWVGKGER